MPERIQLKRVKGWRKPDNMDENCTKCGNPMTRFNDFDGAKKEDIFNWCFSCNYAINLHPPMKLGFYRKANYYRS